jgi:phosphoribosylglycinamide formyltransferase-1
LVALTFDRLLQATLVERFRGRIINVHPSLLPAFSGSRGLERTVASGSRFAGATIHVVTSELDAGPIIAQCVLAKGADESSASVGGRLYLHLRPMFLQVLCWFAEGRVYFRPDGQVRVAGGSYETLPVSPAIERRFEE